MRPVSSLKLPRRFGVGVLWEPKRNDGKRRLNDAALLARENCNHGLGPGIERGVNRLHDETKPCVGCHVSHQMNAIEANAAVEEASNWARWLVQRESRGTGDRRNAMQRVANRHPGLSAGLIHNLIYRAPSDMLMSKWLAVRRAYLTECERQEAMLRHEREITEAKTLLGKALVRASDALGDQSDGDLED